MSIEHVQMQFLFQESVMRSTRFPFGCVISSGKKLTRVSNSSVRVEKCSLTSGSVEQEQIFSFDTMK